jgi:hypothetical protein
MFSSSSKTILVKDCSAVLLLLYNLRAFLTLIGVLVQTLGDPHQAFASSLVPLSSAGRVRSNL